VEHVVLRQPLDPEPGSSELCVALCVPLTVGLRPMVDDAVDLEDERRASDA